MNRNLKRVDWKMGQMLLPHHLTALEEGLLGQFKYILHQTLPLSWWGLSHIVWDPYLLSDGLLSIQELSLIFSSGESIALPGNATLANFDLNREGVSSLTLYLHLLGKSEQEEEIIGTEGSSKVHFTLSQLSLSPHREIDGSRAVFELLHLRKSPDNKWSLTQDYLPPLLNLSSPLFSERRALLNSQLEGIQSRLSRELEQPEFFPTQRFEARLALLSIARIRRLLLNAPAALTLHPYLLYEAIQELLDTVRSPEESVVAPYEHESLGPLFTSLAQQIERLFINEQQGFSSLRFERRDGLYWIDSLPQQLLKAREVYFVVQKPAVSSPLNLQGLKLTSRERLPHIRQFSLPGIPLIPIRKPSFFNTGLSEESDVFTIEEGGEWKLAVEEGNLVLMTQELTANFNLFLFWRVKHGSD